MSSIAPSISTFAKDFSLLTEDGVEAVSLDNRKVELAGKWPGRVKVEKVVKETGLYFRIRRPNGLIFFVR